MTLDVDAAISERQRNFRSNIDQRIDRRGRHITFLRANAMAKIRASFCRAAASVPMTFVRIDRITRFALFVVVADVVENKKLSFGSKVSNVGDARALQITLGANRGGTWIEGVA